MTWWLVLWFCVGCIVGQVIAALIVRPRIRRLRADLEQLTSGEALSASAPRVQLRIRHRRPGQTLGRAIALHDVDELPGLLREWAQLDLPDLELGQGDVLESELLIGDLDSRPLPTVRTWSRR